MTLQHILILAVVQGLTEFLPVSSSGHLALIGPLTGLPDQGLDMDIAVHAGTLLAVMVYFYRDVWSMARGVWLSALRRRDPDVRLVMNVFIASLPLVLVGYFMRDIVAHLLRNPEIIAWATIGFGLLLWLADAVGMTIRKVEHINPGMALILGCAQVLALIPGASRSGVTMTAGRLLGMERASAARFSMLMSIPALLGAGTLLAADVLSREDWALGMDALIGGGLAFVAALLAIAVMMAWLRRASFRIFVIYRLLLGGGLLFWLYYV